MKGSLFIAVCLSTMSGLTEVIPWEYSNQSRHSKSH